MEKPSYITMNFIQHENIPNYIGVLYYYYYMHERYKYILWQSTKNCIYDTHANMI